MDGMEHGGNLFDTAESLMLLMLGLATNLGLNEAKDYRQLRQRVLADPLGRKLAPRFVHVCRDPDAFWEFIKAKHSGSGCWDRRREMIRNDFETLLAAAEGARGGSPVEDLVAEGVRKLSADSVNVDWRKALDRRSTDPEGAVTAARSLLESVCKTILDDLGEAYGSKDDLPSLYRKTAEVLNLAPSDHAERELKRILGGCTTVVEGLGSLRNLGGDAHGRGRTSYRLAPRHAALAVNLAGSTALFLTETFEERHGGRAPLLVAV